MRRFLRDNGLSIVFGLLFVATLVGQALVGHSEFNHEQVAHQSDVLENWQSEYLQFSLYILGTIWLLHDTAAEG